MDFKKWAVILLLFSPSPLEAHGLFTFAWVESDQICTDSYFSRHRKARGARISMIDSAGATLGSGLTDAQGGFCFKRPERPQRLVFVVEAEGGHRGEFTLPAENLPPAAEAGAETGGFSEPGASLTEVTSDQAEILSALRQLVREEVRAELAAQLGPLNRKLAAGEARTDPGLREIVGGLGWLAGLAGLGFWWTARNRGRLQGTTRPS